MRPLLFAMKLTARNQSLDRDAGAGMSITV
jgi:hypothetical protein